MGKNVEKTLIWLIILCSALLFPFAIYGRLSRESRLGVCVGHGTMEPLRDVGNNINPQVITGLKRAFCGCISQIKQTHSA